MVIKGHNIKQKINVKLSKSDIFASNTLFLSRNYLVSKIAFVHCLFGRSTK